MVRGNNNETAISSTTTRTVTSNPAVPGLFGVLRSTVRLAVPRRCVRTGGSVGGQAIGTQVLASLAIFCAFAYALLCVLSVPGTEHGSHAAVVTESARSGKAWRRHVDAAAALAGLHDTNVSADPTRDHSRDADGHGRTSGSESPPALAPASASLSIPLRALRDELVHHHMSATSVDGTGDGGRHQMLAALVAGCFAIGLLVVGVCVLAHTSKSSAYSTMGRMACPGLDYVDLGVGFRLVIEPVCVMIVAACLAHILCFDSGWARTPSYEAFSRALRLCCAA